MQITSKLLSYLSGLAQPAAGWQWLAGWLMSTHTLTSRPRLAPAALVQMAAEHMKDRFQICVNRDRDYLGHAGKQNSMVGKRQDPLSKDSGL